MVATEFDRTTGPRSWDGPGALVWDESWQAPSRRPNGLNSKRRVE